MTSEDRCPECGYGKITPIRIYSEARAKWLEDAANQWRNPIHI